MTVILLIIKTFLSKVIATILSWLKSLVNFAKNNPKTTACIVGAILISVVSSYLAYGRGVDSQKEVIESLTKNVAEYKKADEERKDKLEKLETLAKDAKEASDKANTKNKEDLDKLVKDYEVKLSKERSVSKVIRVPYTVEIIKEGKTITLPQEYSLFVGSDNKPYCDRLSNAFLTTVNDILKVDN